VSLPARIATLVVAFAAVVAGGVFIAVYYIGANPQLVSYTSAASGGSVNVVLQEDPQNNSSSKPDWVSYYVQDPKTHAWVHTTLFQVPKGTRVNMTILGYDGCTPARNNYWSQVQGTVGNSMTVQQFKDTGKPITGVKSMSTLNTWSDCSVGHSFAIPALGVFVPIASPNTDLFNKEGCSDSPCTEGPYSQVKFSFNVPNHTGTYRWQCLIPCGGGFLDGFGGPMQTIGYMMGNMEVTA
jgi:hypothetical protein